MEFQQQNLPPLGRRLIDDLQPGSSPRGHWRQRWRPVLTGLSQPALLCADFAGPGGRNDLISKG